MNMHALHWAASAVPTVPSLSNYLHLGETTSYRGAVEKGKEISRVGQAAAAGAGAGA